MAETKRLPRDQAAERQVLGSCYQFGGEVYHDIADIVTANTFSVGSNANIWACMEHALKDNPNGRIDYPSLMSSAQAIGLGHVFRDEKEQVHLRAVADCPVIPQNARKLAARIRRLEVARLLHSQLEQARDSLSDVTGDESIDQILAKAEGPIFDFTSLLTGQQSSGPRLMGQGAVEYMQFLMDNPREMIGVSTGLAMYDFALGGGIRVNSLDIIAARPKTGKTMLVDNIALYIAGVLGIPVLNLDTEMSWEEHMHRVCANLAGVATHDIETGKCVHNLADRSKVLGAAKRLEDMPYHYECVIGKEFEEVLASMRRWVTRTVGLDPNTGKAKPCIIIYDYLKMMSADFLSGDLKEYQALGFITTALKNFMGRFGVGCLCFAQLNREGIDKEDASVISGSDRIVHYCTSLSLYKKKSDEEKAEAGGEDAKYTHKLVPLLGRHGEGLADGDYINIEAQYKYGRIVEGPTRDQLAKKKGAGNVQDEGFVLDGDERSAEDVGL